jgi:hypothetical protein
MLPQRLTRLPDLLQQLILMLIELRLPLSLRILLLLLLLPLLSDCYLERGRKKK